MRMHLTTNIIVYINGLTAIAYVYILVTSRDRHVTGMTLSLLLRDNVIT